MGKQFFDLSIKKTTSRLGEICQCSFTSHGLCGQVCVGDKEAT